MRQWVFILHVVWAYALHSLPPVQWTTYDHDSLGFSLETVPRTVYIDSAFARISDAEGLTLIPPTAYEFAEIFCGDLSLTFGGNWTLEQVDEVPTSAIYLGALKSNISPLTYENGRHTEEGYDLRVSNGSVYIGGSGARGMFWGTRTLLQELIISNGSLRAGYTRDAPAYATRGYMLDAGRKWYNANFLKELCTYASFFKMSEFHYHSSDNYPLNRGHNETWQEVFSHFSLYPEQNTELRGIVQRQNETLSRAEFEDFQKHCAQRGITVIPEIEAPGHALAITKWRPELALEKRDLLNLTHPHAVPTVKAIWAEFLPWFQTKEVHIGADEYDPDLADDYINFVNEMAKFINETSRKRVRIWGTYEPSDDLQVSKDIVIQHWQYGQSDPVELQDSGYDVINSQDWWAYMSLKNDHMPILPAPYPQFYNVSRTLNFANVPGLQWDPSMFNLVNITEQLKPGASGNRGAILAAWNDNGPDATTQLEAYYAMREGIPAMAARAWASSRGVKLQAEKLAESTAFLASRAPGQNLDRRFPGPQDTAHESPLLDWTCQSAGRGTPIHFGKGSYGPPYTLTLHASSPFTLSGPDTVLSLALRNDTSSNAKIYNLIFSTADDFPYPLHSVSITDGFDPGHPGRIWTNVSTSSHEPVSISLPAKIKIETDVANGSRVWIDNKFAGRFEVFVFGGRNTLFSWSQMALVAPLDTIKGGVDSVVLEAGVDVRGCGSMNDSHVDSVH
ncbi:hypothetical protein NX059_001030 [Plenodomus lindquistii]|nr:hypothetical protein NX059_001030 [Plenodomus lindquistii]